MYNMISIVLLIAALNSIQHGNIWFGILLGGSGIFAIAGAIQSIIFRIDKILDSQVKIKIHYLVNDDISVDFEKIENK